jgi:protein tyrosine phosphatase (PTP) superfamily phosphohydrolase (DUF442 family)
MESELEEIYNFLPISDTLSTGGMPTEDQLYLLQEAGYAVVINLAMPNQLNALRDEAGIVRDLGMEYISIPVVFNNPTAEDLTQAMDALDAHAGQKVFMHCMANYRVASFVYLYRVLRQGVPEAEAAVQLHQVWQPNEVWAAFIRRQLAHGTA